VQASKDTDANLKNMVMGISHKNEQNKENRANRQMVLKKNNNPKDEIGETQNLQLQLIMDHKSGMAEEVTYIMKKISGSQQDIIKNLR
jgi:hypothetical protein